MWFVFKVTWTRMISGSLDHFPFLTFLSIPSPFCFIPYFLVFKNDSLDHLGCASFLRMRSLPRFWPYLNFRYCRSKKTVNFRFLWCSWEKDGEECWSLSAIGAKWLDLRKFLIPSWALYSVNCEAPESGEGELTGRVWWLIPIINLIVPDGEISMPMRVFPEAVGSVVFWHN